MVNTDLHNVTKTPFSYNKSVEWNKDFVAIRKILNCNSKFYTSDWQIQKNVKQQNKERQNN